MDEFLIYFLGLLFEFAVEGLADLFSRRYAVPKGLIAFIYFGAFAAAVGFLSKFVFPTPFISHEPLRYVNLFFTPLLVGAGMRYFGKWMESKGRSRGWLEYFVHGTFFAFCFEAARILATRS